MKVQVTLLINVEIERGDYRRNDTDVDADLISNMRDDIDNGNVSVDDLVEQSTDYTVTVVEAPAS